MITYHESIDPVLVATLGHGEFESAAYFPLLDQLFEAIRAAKIIQPKHAPRWLSRNCNLNYFDARTIVNNWNYAKRGQA